jgi:molecular chaperone DnaJ
MGKRDFYEVLGLRTDATNAELLAAYKKASVELHPDRNPGDAEARAALRDAHEAYVVLTDPEKRAVYDRFGHAGLEPAPAAPAPASPGDVFGHMQQLFGEMFGGGVSVNGSDLRARVVLSPGEAKRGCTQELIVAYPVTCTDCGGSGARPGTPQRRCSDCRGTGQVAQPRGFVTFTSTCAACGGRGFTFKEKCRGCAGGGQRERSRKVNVTLAAGTVDGQTVKVSGEGLPPGSKGGEPGDLYVDVVVK